MILQNLVLPQGGCLCEELYVHRSRPNGRECWDFCTYFNSFPLARWKRYSTVTSIRLDVEIGGNALLKIVGIGSDGRQNELSVAQISGEGTMEVPDTDYGMIGVLCILEPDSEFVSGSFGTPSVPDCIPMMVLDMCTYHREDQVREKIQSFSRSLDRFGEPYSSHVRMVVVDNGSTLNDVSDGIISMVKGSNIGGSGGFARGLYEARHTTDGLSHILFMDDDITLDFESVYRVFSLLCYVRQEYAGHMIAGAMLNSLKPHEIFESGKMLSSGEPLGRGVDVSDAKGMMEADSIPDPEAGGWWFFCSPYVSANDYPVPFFVGYDDLMYSRMHGSSIIAMPGIGVWHPPLDSKYRPSRLFYYDVRNSMFFNDFSGKGTRKIVSDYFRKGVAEILCMRRLNADLISMAFRDYCKGIDVLKDLVEKDEVVDSISYGISCRDAPEVVLTIHSRNSRLWTVLTINGQLLPSFGDGRASKTCICTEGSYRVRRMVHYDEGSGWFETEKDVLGSIRSIMKLMFSSARAYIGRHEGVGEMMKISSESYWEGIFESND